MPGNNTYVITPDCGAGVKRASPSPLPPAPDKAPRRHGVTYVMPELLLLEPSIAMETSDVPSRRTALPHGLPSRLFLGLVGVSALGAILLSGAAGTREHVLQAGAVLLVLGGWAVTLCLHEFGHAAVAYYGGDISVRDKGYLRLDPRRYTDPVLSILLPIALLAIGGIPLPGGAVWIERHRLRSRGIEAAVAAAGPVVNLLSGVLLIAAVGGIRMPLPLAEVLSYLALIQLVAFVLNMLPVPGLDGFGVLDPFLSASTRELANKVCPYAPLALFALLFSSPTAARLVFDAARVVFEAMGGSSWLASLGQAGFLFWR